jgi:hypothetical protein
MRHHILLAAVIALSVGPAQAATAPAKAPPKGVKCGDSYIAAGQVCHKAPAPAAKGVKCGDSYIAAGQVCHKTTAAAAPAKTAMMAPAKPAAAPAKPMAAKPAVAPAKGKKCGNSYIAANAVCTKK